MPRYDSPDKRGREKQGVAPGIPGDDTDAREEPTVWDAMIRCNHVGAAAQRKR